MIRLRFRRRVALDVTQTTGWYDGEREGLGDQFLEELELTLERVRALPKSFPVVAGTTRRAGVNRFPYAVYFELEDDDVVTILAMMHSHRQPNSEGLPPLQWARPSATNWCAQSTPVARWRVLSPDSPTRARRHAR